MKDRLYPLKLYPRAFADHLFPFEGWMEARRRLGSPQRPIRALFNPL